MTTELLIPQDGSTPPPENSNTEATFTEEQLRKAVLAHDPKFHADLNYYVDHAVNSGLHSWSEMSDELDIDVSTISRVFRGIYNVRDGKPQPPGKLLSAIRSMRRNEIQRDITRDCGLIHTPTMQSIWNVCDKAGQDHLIAMIFGASHIGKTKAIRAYEAEASHQIRLGGRIIYVDLQGCTGVGDVYREFLLALDKSERMCTRDLRSTVMTTLKPADLVLIDEYSSITYAFKKGSSNQMVLALKDIHDRTGCGMVIVATDIARVEFEKGRDMKLLNQLWRRGTIKLQLPDTLPVPDVRMIVENYGLDFPEPRRTDTWAAQLSAHPELTWLPVVHQIAHDQGIQSLISTLKDSNILAAKEHRTITWSDLIAVQAIYAAQSAPKEA